MGGYGKLKGPASSGAKRPDGINHRRQVDIWDVRSLRLSDTYTEPEVRGWMEEAGLCGITRQDTAFNNTLVIGRKPAA